MVQLFRVLLADIIDVSGIRRGLQSQGGHAAPDVHVPLVHVESKFRQRIDVFGSVAQAERDRAARGREGQDIAIAFCKRDRERPIVAMNWEDFGKLFRAYTKSKTKEEA